DTALWPALQARYGVEARAAPIIPAGHGLTVDISFPRKTTLRQDVEEATVVSARTLTADGPDVPVKKHVELRLPSNMTYRAGDYLAVLPLNPKATVARVFKHFHLCWDAALTIHSDGPTSLPTGSTVSAADVLGAYVELSQPATKRNIQGLAEATEDPDVAEQLGRLAGADYADEISAKRVSILDLLERFPAISLPFGAYLHMLPPMRVRHSRLTLTYSVLKQRARSGHGSHIGVASNFLSSLAPGDSLHVAVRPSDAFHLPADAEKTPLVCVAAG
ncbi:hypothetical protein E4U42_002128, partial [Claviceps africana]